MTNRWNAFYRTACQSLHYTLIACLFGALLTNAAFSQENSPMETVRTMITDVLGILGSPDYNLDEDFEDIDAAITRAFDANTLAQSALGQTWREINNEQRQEFENLFFQLLKGTYIERLEAYNDQSVDYLGEQIDGNRGQVSTVIVGRNTRIPVNYALRQRPNGWFIYDVQVEGISLLSSYRSEYRSIIRRSGIEGLLEQMRTRVAALE